MKDKLQDNLPESRIPDEQASQQTRIHNSSIWQVRDRKQEQATESNRVKPNLWGGENKGPTQPASLGFGLRSSAKRVWGGEEATVRWDLRGRLERQRGGGWGLGGFEEISKVWLGAHFAFAAILNFSISVNALMPIMLIMLFTFQLSISLFVL